MRVHRKWPRGLVVISVFAVIVWALPAMAQQATPDAASRPSRLSVSPKRLNFAKLNLAKRSAKSKYVRVTNKGNSDLHVSFGSTTAPFAVACSCTQVTLPPHKSVSALIAFQPNQDGTYSGTFDISSDAGKGPASVVLNLKGTAVGTPPASASSVLGAVTGGDQPLSNATVNLFAAGDDQSRSDATLLGTTTTDSQGQFKFVQVQCPAPGSQVYVISSGGTPSGCSSSDPALVFLAVLGTCSGVHAEEAVLVNEMTTAASSSMLAPFVSGDNPSAIGSASANSNQLDNAFAAAEQMQNQIAPQAGIGALGEAIGSCAQCGGSNSACQNLLSCSSPGAVSTGSACAEGSAQITDTLQAAMSIAGSPLSPSGSATGDISD